MPRRRPGVRFSRDVGGREPGQRMPASPSMSAVAGGDGHGRVGAPLELSVGDDAQGVVPRAEGRWRSRRRRRSWCSRPLPGCVDGVDAAASRWGWTRLIGSLDRTGGSRGDAALQAPRPQPRRRPLRSTGPAYTAPAPTVTRVDDTRDEATGLLDPVELSGVCVVDPHARVSSRQRGPLVGSSVASSHHVGRPVVRMSSWA
jgi:hypothetical protein